MKPLGPPPQELIDSFGVSYAVACAFFTDAEGRLLLVKAGYRNHWQFVGGMVDKGESPHEACTREINEEIGLSLPVHDLLVLDWVGLHDFVSAPMGIFIFDGGVIDDPDLIRLQSDELDEFGFFPLDQATSLFPEGHQERVELASEARRTGKTVYQPLLKSR
jgi:8-oxo-dGTP pyrophosphatase MutT (NUDIX family)